ncbi:MAG: hypothetical protein AAF843_06535 [Bacteroidota bacterium]
MERARRYFTGRLTNNISINERGAKQNNEENTFLLKFRWLIQVNSLNKAKNIYNKVGNINQTPVFSK